MKKKTLPRRRFLSLTGGGIVLAATGATAGCAQNPFSMPADAISAWREPSESLSLGHWVLSHALLAPNPHNRQPWRVSLPGEHEIHLSLDPDRLLPHTDPFGRQILIGTGAFIELLSMAAAQRGYQAQVTLFPKGAFEATRKTADFDDRPVAHIRLVEDQTVQANPLFAYVFDRHTERGMYDRSRAIPAQMSDGLNTITSEPSVTGGIAHRSGQQEALTRRVFDIAKQAWAIELKTPHTMMESVELLRVGAGEISEYRDGISITDPMLVMIDKLGLFDRATPPDPDGSVVAGQIDEFNEAIDSTPGIFWLNTRDNSRVSQIAAGRAYMHAQLLATSLGLVMQPISQALQEYPEMAKPFDSVQKSLKADPQTGPTVQMMCRIGYLAASTQSTGPSPRRGLDAHLQA
ncbi:MAG: twin-arginine translocation pathway signal protein [Burkholderiaceae bacterium]